MNEGGDDMRQDAVMQQVFQHVNHTLEKDDDTRKRALCIRTYKVIPTTPQTGTELPCLAPESSNMYSYYWLNAHLLKLTPPIDQNRRILPQKFEFLARFEKTFKYSATNLTSLYDLTVGTSHYYDSNFNDFTWIWAGVLEWVMDTIAFSSYLTDKSTGSHTRYYPDDLTSQQCR